MVNIIRAEAGVFNFFHGQIFGQLVNDSTDHFKMRQFFGPYVCEQTRNFSVRHGITLGEIAHGSA